MFKPCPPSMIAFSPLATRPALSLLACTAAIAQEPFAHRPIVALVPFGADSGTDTGARILAKDLGELLNATVVVDNKPGANGAIAAKLTARTKPDGRTLLMGSATVNAVNFAFFPGKLGDEPASFEPVAGLGMGPVSLYGAHHWPWRTLADFLAVAAARRHAPHADTATFAAQGLVAFEFTAWTAAFAPAGTPAAVLERLNAAIRKAQDSPDSVAARQRSGSLSLNFNLAERRPFTQDEVHRWARHVKDSGVKPP